MIKIRENKILVYSFFLIFVLASARSIVGPLIPVIAEDLNIGLDVIGSAISLSIFGLLIVSITAGNLIELFGLKKVAFLGLIFGFFGSLGLYLSSSFIIFVIAYFILQMGLAIVFVCILSIIGNYYFRSRASSLIKVNIGNTLTFIFSPLIVSLMIFMNLNWRLFYIYILIPQIILMVALIFLKVPEKVKVKSDLRTLFVINRKITSNPYFILCCIIVFFYASVINIFFMWFTSYFSSLNISIGTSSLFLSIYGVSFLIGMLLRNKIIKHLSEKRILFFSFIAAFILLLGVLFTNNLVLKNILIFLFGISIAGNFTITFSIGSGLFPEYANSASGFLVASANLGIMIFQYLSGYFSEHFSKNSVLYINIILLFILFIAVLILNMGKKFLGIYTSKFSGK